MPWSVEFRRMKYCLNLRDSRQGFGIYPTWPTFNPLLGIPIDHVLVSSGIQIGFHRPTNSFGSDHFPLFTRFNLNPPAR